jgi:putative flippase GtrA
MLLATRHLPPLIRHHRPAAGREGSPQPDAADGRAAIVNPVPPGLGRPVARSIWDEVRSFATIGVASTLAYVVLFTALRSVATAAVANAVALVVTAIGNTAANRRLTFRITGRETMLRDQAAGLAAFGLALAITTGAVGLLERVAPNPGRALEIVVLVAANGLATVARFVLLRTWISGRRSHPTTYDELEGSLS